MPQPIDSPPDAPGYAYGPLSNTVRPPPATQGVVAPAPSLLDRVIGLFHPSPSPVPSLLSRTQQLEKENDALQFRSSQSPTPHG